MDDDNNKGSGILGLGDTPISNRGADDLITDTEVTRDRIRDDDDVTRDRARIRDNEETTREGTAAGTGILGLGGAPVPKSPLDPSASEEVDSSHRRRERMLDDERTAAEGVADRHAGAAGIDMGSGGEGTDVSGR